MNLTDSYCNRQVMYASQVYIGMQLRITDVLSELNYVRQGIKVTVSSIEPCKGSCNRNCCKTVIRAYGFIAHNNRPTRVEVLSCAVQYSTLTGIPIVANVN